MEPKQLTGVENALHFLLAGKAIFTLRSVKTGTRYTYKVSVPHDTVKANGFNGWFVSLLSGPDNTSDYQYIGMITAEHQFKLTRASKLSADSKPVKAISWVLAKLAANQEPAGVEIWHEGRCGKCGRKLTVPESIASGFGPECASQI